MSLGKHHVHSTFSSSRLDSHSFLSPYYQQFHLVEPNKVLWSNFAQWIPQEQVPSEAFVFLENEAVFCPGMEKTFLVFAKLILSPGNDGWTRLICPSQFQVLSI
jgi:hypothetical protein